MRWKCCDNQCAVFYGKCKMQSNEVPFRHVGLSSDGAVIFCEMDNGKTYAMPVGALEQAEEWNPKAKPKSTVIIHDGYAAVVEFDSGVEIDFPSDFVLHVCEPSYAYYKDKRRAVSGVGGRIREIRQARGLTLDALAAKSGIAKPNLSRLENDKVTPSFETLRTIAAALETHPVLLFPPKNPKTPGLGRSTSSANGGSASGGTRPWPVRAWSWCAR